MGFTPRYGLKDCKGNEFHIESKENGNAIVIWSGDETRSILRMNIEEARKLCADLDLLCSMKEDELTGAPCAALKSENVYLSRDAPTP